MALPNVPSVSISTREGGVNVTVSGFSDINRLEVERYTPELGWRIILGTTDSSYLVSPTTVVDFGPSGDYGSPTDVYGYRARVRNEDGFSPWSSTQSGSPLPIPQVGTPTNFLLTAGHTFIKASWTSGLNNDRWQLERESPDGMVTSIYADSESYTNRGLVNGETYRFRLRGQRTSGVQGWSSWTGWLSSIPIATGDSAPSAPANMTAAPGDEQIAVGWDNPNDASITHYEYQYTNLDQGGGNDWETIPMSGSNTTSYTVTGLQNGSRYQVLIRAVNSVSAGSATGAYATPNDSINPLPGTPTGFDAGPGNERATLFWDDPGDSFISGYEYQQNSGAWETMTDSTARTVSYVVDSLVNGTDYTFKIRAVNVNGNSPETQQKPVRPLASVASPLKPTGIKATPGNGIIRLSWSNPGDTSITHYQYKIGTGVWQNMTDSNSATVFYDVPESNNFNFTFRIRAVNDFGESDQSDAVSATAKSTPPMPTSFTGTIGNGQVTLDWGHADYVSITGWQYSQDSGTWQNITDSDPDTVQVVITGLTNEQSYTFRVRAINGSITGPSSNSIILTPSATATPPAKPTGLSAEVGNERIILTWDDPSNSTISLYQFKVGLSAWKSINGSGAETTTYTIRGLPNDNSYSVSIRARNLHGPSTASNSIIATPTGVPLTIYISNDSINNNVSDTLWMIDPDDTDRATGGFGNVGSMRHDLNNPLSMAYQDEETLWVASSAASGNGSLWKVNPADPDQITDGYGDQGELPFRVISGLSYQDENTLWATDPTANKLYKVNPADPDQITDGYGDQGGFPSALTNANGCAYVNATEMWIVNDSSGSTLGTLWKVNPADPDQITDGYGNQGELPADITNAVGILYQNSLTVWVVDTGTDTLWVIDTRDPSSQSAPYGNKGSLPSGLTQAGGMAGIFPDEEDPNVLEEPDGLIAVASTNSVNISWRSVPGAIRYELRYWEQLGDGWIDLAGNNFTEIEYDHVGLTAGLYYWYAVRAIFANDAAGAWSDAVAVRTGVEGTPSAPLRLTADLQESGILLTWDAPLDDGGTPISSYEILRWYDGEWVSVADNVVAEASSWVDTEELVSGENYRYVVRAENAIGNGIWSEVALITILDPNSPVPSPPRRLIVDAQSTGVVLTWLTPEIEGIGGSISGYNIWRNHNDIWTEIVTDTDNTYTTYTDTDTTLIDGAFYWYVVRAINPSGNGEWSETSGAFINPKVASSPRRLLADAQSTGVVLTWLAPADVGLGGAISGYNIWRWDETNDWQEVEADTGDTDVGYTDTDTTLIDGATYWYAVRAINPSGNGEWSETSGAFINPKVASAPLRLVVTETSSGVMLDWEIPVDSGLGGSITGYNIWRWDEINRWVEVIADTGDTDTDYTDTSTLEDGWNWWAVRAINPSGNGEWSETSGVTTATNVPSQPTSLIAIEVEDGVQLTWGEPFDDGGSEIVGYRIWRSDGADWAELVSDTGNDDITYLDTTIKSLGAGIYYYRINALTANGLGDFSAIASITIAGILSIEMPERDSNYVFGNWWVLVQPEITNPAGNFLIYEWSQVGGIIINNIDTQSTYIKFPDGTDEEQPVNVTLTVTDMVANNKISETVEFLVISEPENNSLFYSGTTSEITGVAWYAWTQIWEYLDGDGGATGDVGLVDSRRYETRAYVQMNENVTPSPAYVGALAMRNNGAMLFNLADTPDDPNYGVDPNPQLTDYAEQNFGLALQLPNGNQYKWVVDDLVISDTTDPYTFSASSIAAAGQANNQAFRNVLLDFWNARLVIVDITSTFVDWDDLEVISIDPTVSIAIVDTTVDSETSQTISGFFDDFRDVFEDIDIAIEATNGTLGVLKRDNVAGFWSITWDAPSVISGTQSSTITITVENSFKP